LNVSYCTSHPILLKIYSCWQFHTRLYQFNFSNFLKMCSM
jgi:hypothetical protein